MKNLKLVILAVLAWAAASRAAERGGVGVNTKKASSTSVRNHNIGAATPSPSETSGESPQAPLKPRPSVDNSPETPAVIPNPTVDNPLGNATAPSTSPDSTEQPEQPPPASPNYNSLSVPATSIFVSILLILILIFGLLISKNQLSKFVPGLSGVSMLFGVLTGIVLEVLDVSWHDIKFSPDFFFYVLLPPIIFEAGFSLDHRMFSTHILGIMSFAVFGTLISAVVISKGLNWMKFESLEDPLICDLFGSLISATDPVATIALLNRFSDQFPGQLKSLIFGESVFNDAVAIVLFDSILGRMEAEGYVFVDVGKRGNLGATSSLAENPNNGDLMQPTSFDTNSHYYYLILFWDFVYVSVLSICIGLFGSVVVLF